MNENVLLLEKLDHLARELDKIKQSGQRYVEGSFPPNWFENLKNSIGKKEESFPQTEKMITKISEPMKTKKDTLLSVADEVASCVACSLSETRTNTVPGEGNKNARLMFIGEAPGKDEDLQGRPFIGRAGRLLTDMITAMGLSRDEVYIANVLKCRPPGNRDPLPQEIELCEPFLLRQIALVKPEVICALGRISAQALLKTKTPIGKLRGEFHDYHSVPLLPTYHPAYLLRSPAEKKEAWKDLQMIMKKLNIKPPTKKSS